jgi:hypothetical protein
MKLIIASGLDTNRGHEYSLIKKMSSAQNRAGLIKFGEITLHFASNQKSCAARRWWPFKAKLFVDETQLMGVFLWAIHAAKYCAREGRIDVSWGQRFQSRP